LKIIKVKEAFKYKPQLREKEFLDLNDTKIIICDENQEYLDIGLLNTAHSEDKKWRGQRLDQNQLTSYTTAISGIFYHYVIKGPGESSKPTLQYDGLIYECRPLFQKNELPSNKREVRNSIAICLGGKEGSTLSDSQKKSLVDLCIYLIEQENLKVDNISSFAEMNGSGGGNFSNLEEVKDEVVEKMKFINIYKTINYEPIGAAKNITKYHKFVVGEVMVEKAIMRRDFDNIEFKRIDWNALEEIAMTISDNPKDTYDTLLLMNPHITDPLNIEPNTVVFTPDLPRVLERIGESQSLFIQNLTRTIERKIDYELIEKERYLQTKDVRTDYDDVNVYFSSYGGKAAPKWKDQAWEMPGYHNCILRFTDLRGGQKIIPFLISPSSFQESRSNTQQMNKTNAGWFLMRTGKNPINISFTGFMLDMKHELERHKFLTNYKTYSEDVKNNNFEYVSQYKTELVIEGRTYYGFIQNISFNKAAIQKFLYQYSISYVALDEKFTYNDKYAVSSNTELIPYYQKMAIPVLKNMPERIYNTLST